MVSLEPGPEFKARYDILEELGKGRFGVVHKVVDKTTSQKLAAKFIRCRTSKDRDKVQEEIDIMNQLRHQKLLQLAAAFENPKEMIMVMEYISGGELFERVVADDFTLTEKDCILFVRQICEGVDYMHSQNIVHLDLKPENIMCHTRTSHEIKIIDFGLAQRLDPEKPTRVLFGTPEFIPPEIINYEPIGLKSDMWSIGVICYVLLSGLSPFMGDNDAETFANITRADYDFDDEAFNTVSQNARDFISALLVNRKEDRLSAEKCLKHTWLDPENHQETVILSTDKLKKFIIRRKWQKTGNAIRALGRMATLSASRRNSTNNSTPNTPRPSLTGTTVNSMVSRMSSLNEENNFLVENGFHSLTLEDTVQEVDQLEEETSNIAPEAVSVPESNLSEHEDENVQPTIINQNEESIELKKNTTESISQADNNGNYEIKGETLTYTDNINEEITSEMEIIKIGENDSKEQNTNHSPKSVKMRSCTERSDSGISCSSHLTTSSCTSTPLLDSSESLNYTSSKLMTLSSKFESKENLTNKQKDIFPSEENLRTAIRCKGVNVKLEDKIETFEFGKSSSSTNGLKKVPMYSTYTSRTVANAIKKFDHLDKTPPSTKAPSKNNKTTNVEHKIETTPKIVEKKKEIPSKLTEPKTRSRSKSPCVEKNLSVSTKTTLDRSRLRPTSPCPQAKKSPIVAPKITVENKNSIQKSEITVTDNCRVVHSNIISNRLGNSDTKCVNSNSINVPQHTLRYRSPSPSLLRKTQAVIAKEQSNERYVNKIANKNSPKPLNGTKTPSKLNPSMPRIDKPQSEKFQRVAAFWNAPKT